MSEGFGRSGRTTQRVFVRREVPIAARNAGEASALRTLGRMVNGAAKLRTSVIVSAHSAPVSLLVTSARFVPRDAFVGPRLNLYVGPTIVATISRAVGVGWTVA